MNIKLLDDNNNRNFVVQQRNDICPSCNYKLWCAIGEYEGWAACIRCNTWSCKNFLEDPNNNYESFGKMNTSCRQQLLIAEYEMGDYKTRSEIMTLILGKGE